MPRYCAVKVCINRGGASSKQEHRRISFYPFPLQDKPRLQRWVDNMKRADWTPSRHQYLCNEHFTEDCFDVRWGIRYLKNTAVPTVFPSAQDEGEKNIPTSNRNLKAQTTTCDIETELTGSTSPPHERPLNLTWTTKAAAQPTTTTNNRLSEDGEMTYPIPVGLFELPLVSEAGASSDASLNEALLSEIQTAACDGGMLTASCLTRSHSEALSDAFSFVPVDCVLEDRGPGEAEYVCVYEHSYCRPDTDKEQLWSKIFSLHAKILELDRREESTVDRIRALESEIAHLKRDGAVFREKQKLLEDFISSILL